MRNTTLHGVSMIPFIPPHNVDSPEILSNQKYNNKADLWSLGAIIYEMLFGEPPYKANNIIELQKFIANGPPSKLFKYGDKSENSITHLLLGLLQSDPSKRFSFEQFYNHPYIKGIREEFGDTEELSQPPATATPTPTISENLEPQDNEEDQAPPEADIVDEDEQVPEPFVEVDTATQQEAPPEVNITNKASKSVIKTSSSTPTTEEKDQTDLIIMDKRVPTSALSNNQIYHIESMMGTNADALPYPAVLFDFSNLKCDEHCVEKLEKLEKQTTRSWFIAETACLMFKSAKYSEAFALYTRSCIILRSVIEAILSEPLTERSRETLNFVRQCFSEFYERAEMIKTEKLSLTSATLSSTSSIQSTSFTDVDVTNILYLYAIEIAKEAACKEYLSDSANAREVIAMYSRAKHLLEYLLDEGLVVASDRKYLSEFADQFSQRMEQIQQETKL